VDVNCNLSSQRVCVSLDHPQDRILLEKHHAASKGDAGSKMILSSPSAKYKSQKNIEYASIHVIIIFTNYKYITKM
jgi:hypothetical protein